MNLLKFTNLHKYMQIYQELSKSDYPIPHAICKFFQYCYHQIMRYIKIEKYTVYGDGYNLFFAFDPLSFFVHFRMFSLQNDPLPSPPLCFTSTFFLSRKYFFVFHIQIHAYFFEQSELIKKF